jgi:hypothetical protein
VARVLHLPSPVRFDERRIQRAEDLL